MFLSSSGSLSLIDPQGNLREINLKGPQIESWSDNMPRLQNTAESVCFVEGFQCFLWGLEVVALWASVNPLPPFVAVVWSFRWREMGLAERHLVSLAADLAIEGRAETHSVFVASFW